MYATCWLTYLKEEEETHKSYLDRHITSPQNLTTRYVTLDVLYY